MFAKAILLGVGMLALEASAVVADPLSWKRFKTQEERVAEAVVGADF